MWGCLLCAFISRPLGAPVLFVCQDNPLRKKLSRKTKTPYLQEVSWISQVTTAYASSYTITLYLCVCLLCQAATKWCRFVIVPVQCGWFVFRGNSFTQLLPVYLTYRWSTKLWMFHNSLLQKCTLLFKIVTVLLLLSSFWGFQRFGPHGQTPICMNTQGVVNVFVSLLLRAAFPFPLKKQKKN